MAGRIRSPLRTVRNLFLTGLDPASLAGMAAAVAVAGEYPPPGAGGGPPEFLTGPPGQGPPAPTGGSPGEFLAPSGKRENNPADGITATTKTRKNVYVFTIFNNLLVLDSVILMFFVTRPLIHALERKSPCFAVAEKYLIFFARIFFSVYTHVE